MSDDVTCSWLDRLDLLADCAEPEDEQWLRELHGVMTRRLETECARILEEEGSEMCMDAAEGRLERYKLLCEKNCIYWDTETTMRAAASGNLETLKYLHDHGCPWDAEACRGAVASGKLETLKYLREHGCPWDESIIDLAVRLDHVECLSYALENDCPHSEMGYAKAMHNATPAGLSCLQAHMPPQYQPLHLEHLCRELAAEEARDHLEGRALDEALKNANHLDCLQYTHANGRPWHKQTCINAANYGLESRASVGDVTE